MMKAKNGVAVYNFYINQGDDVIELVDVDGIDLSQGKLKFAGRYTLNDTELAFIGKATAEDGRLRLYISNTETEKLIGGTSYNMPNKLYYDVQQVYNGYERRILQGIAFVVAGTAYKVGQDGSEEPGTAEGEEVGNTSQLQTDSKTLVGAINELHELSIATALKKLHITQPEHQSINANIEYMLQGSEEYATIIPRITLKLSADIGYLPGKITANNDYTTGHATITATPATPTQSIMTDGFSIYLWDGKHVMRIVDANQAPEVITEAKDRFVTFYGVFKSNGMPFDGIEVMQLDKVTLFDVHGSNFNDVKVMLGGGYCFHQCPNLIYADVREVDYYNLSHPQSQQLQHLVISDSFKQDYMTFRNDNGTCIYYVPDDKVADFKNSGHWSAKADRIKGWSEVPDWRKVLESIGG